MTLLPLRFSRFFFQFWLVVIASTASYAAAGPAAAVKPQSANAAGTPLAPRITPTQWHNPAIPQELSGGFWRIDHTFQAKLHIKNVVELAGITVTPVLLMADGTQYVLPPEALAPAGVVTVNINDALANMPAAMRGHLSDFGMASVRYDWSWAGAIAASIQNVDEPRSLVFSSMLPSSMAKMDSATMSKMHPASISQTLEGLWWKHDQGVGGFLGLSNASPIPLVLKIQTFSTLGPTSETHITLQPGTTQMLDFGQIIDALPTPKNLGGIRISYKAAPNALVLNGGLENAAEGYSAKIPFTAVGAGTTKNVTQTYASVGFMNGEQMMMGFQQGTSFSPYAVLRNPGAKPLAVAPTLYYMANMQTMQTKAVQLPLQQLLPNEARALDLKTIFQTAGVPAMIENFNLSFAFEGQPGGLLIATGSVDQTGTYVFEVEPKWVAPSSSKRVSYWNIADGTDTMFTMWNPADQPEDIMVTLFYMDGQYKMPFHLEPRATAMFNLLQVVQAHQPDSDGHTIPFFIRQGSAVISGQQGETEEINLVIDAATFNVRTATCDPQCVQWVR